jgi:flagellar basal-body rod modification protein FlgD
MINPVFNDLGLAAGTTARGTDDGELGQEEFLKLMMTQLKNQDPFKPLESGEFLGQIAQFGTVSGLAQLQTSFDSLSQSLVSNQALQAAGLVGRSVLATGGEGFLAADGPLGGAIELPSSSSTVTVQVRDATGQLVREISLGGRPAGRVDFEWDGTMASGQRAAPGRYSIEAQYFDGAETRSAPTSIEAEVESVSFGARGLAVYLRGIGDVPFSAVQQIG